MPSPPSEVIWWDTSLKGFGVKVTPAGRKIFVVQYRPRGERRAARKYTIGPYGVVSPHQARIEAQRILAERASGRDPQAERQASRRRVASAKLADVVEEFVARHVAQQRSAAETTRILRKDAVAVWAKKSIYENLQARHHRASGRGSRPWCADYGQPGAGGHPQVFRLVRVTWTSRRFSLCRHCRTGKGTIAASNSLGRRAPERAARCPRDRLPLRAYRSSPRIDRGLLVDRLLRRWTEFLQIIGEAEAVQHPFVLRLQQRVAEFRE